MYWKTISWVVSDTRARSLATALSMRARAAFLARQTTQCGNQRINRFDKSGNCFKRLASAVGWINRSTDNTIKFRRVDKRRCHRRKTTHAPLRWRTSAATASATAAAAAAMVVAAAVAIRAELTDKMFQTARIRDHPTRTRLCRESGVYCSRLTAVSKTLLANAFRHIALDRRRCSLPPCTGVLRVGANSERCRSLHMRARTLWQPECMQWSLN